MEISFDNAIIESQLFIADTGANLQNVSGKLNYKHYLPVSQPVEMLFLFRKLPAPQSRTEAFEMLDKLTAACGILSAQTQRIELGITEDYFLDMWISKYARRIFLFGITPRELHLHIQIKKYTRTHWADSVIILCDSLEFLQNNKNSKGLLWNLLKKEFNIS